ncbi:DUF2490 domain-containing protein [Gracilimonas sp.]|uniref:DUF2490 domain-containing protein n=1 Tax=Gracilimonas sp. TaxID=1974203 RepID=UPI003BAB1A74
MNFLKFKVLLVVAVLLPVCAFSQQADLIWNPELSYSWKTSDKLGFKTKLSVFNSIRDFDNKAAIRYIEPQFTFSYALSGGSKIGGGYYYRLSTPMIDGYQYEHRFLQQLGFVSDLGDRKLDHRLRLEQRVRSSSYQNRLRYQLSYDIPLEGDELDSGEKYLILKDEMMTAFNKDEADAENRATVGLGWYFNSKQKFELGLQYRTQDIFSDGGISHLFLLNTSYSLK